MSLQLTCSCVIQTWIRKGFLQLVVFSRVPTNQFLFQSMRLACANCTSFLPYESSSHVAWNKIHFAQFKILSFNLRAAPSQGSAFKNNTQCHCTQFCCVKPLHCPAWAMTRATRSLHNRRSMLDLSSRAARIRHSFAQATPYALRTPKGCFLFSDLMPEPVVLLWLLPSIRSLQWAVAHFWVACWQTLVEQRASHRCLTRPA